MKKEKDILARCNEAVPVESVQTQEPDQAEGFSEPVAKARKQHIPNSTRNLGVLNSNSKFIEAREAIAALYRSIKVEGV